MRRLGLTLGRWTALRRRRHYLAGHEVGIGEPNVTAVATPHHHEAVRPSHQIADHVRETRRTTCRPVQSPAQRDPSAHVLRRDRQNMPKTELRRDVTTPMSKAGTD